MFPAVLSVGLCRRESVGEGDLVAEVKLLAMLAAQDVEDDGAGEVRIAQRVAPDRIISVVDPDARHGHRSRRNRYDGYKLHINVDVDSDLFMASEATAATTSDGEILEDLLEYDPVAVSEVIGDTHYGSTETRRDLAEDGIELTAPAPPASAPEGIFRQSRVHYRSRGRDPHLPGRSDRRHPDHQAPASPSPFRSQGVCCLSAAGSLHQTGGRRIVEINDNEELLITGPQARWTPEFRDRHRQRARVERKNAVRQRLLEPGTDQLVGQNRGGVGVTAFLVIVGANP